MISVIQKEKIQEYYNFFYLKNIKKIIKNEKIENAKKHNSNITMK